MILTTDPRYLAHFTDPVYADNGSEGAPFGLQQGADMLYDYEVAGHDIAGGGEHRHPHALGHHRGRVRRSGERRH
ncbi:hypothetical protein [Nocardioides pacificus]